MRWQITLFGLLLCGFFSFFGLSSLTYAVDDVTYTITDSSHNLTDICNNNCSDYQYLVIDTQDNSGIVSPFCSIYFSGKYGSSTNYGGILYYFPYSTPTSIYTLDNRLTFLSLFYNSPLFTNNYSCASSTYSISITLTNDVGGSSEPCPEPESCPVVPDHPYDDKFDNIEKAIYVCGAILIMLYFFYCIYRMIIKGSGVN